MEIQRCANIVPTGVLHISQNDFTINDIIIPAYTLINPLMTNILKVFKVSFSFFLKDTIHNVKKSYRAVIGRMGKNSGQKGFLMNLEI